MTKTQINEQEYVRLINEKMKGHFKYKESMRVENTPSAEMPSGYKIIGGSDAQTIAAWAESKVKEEYELVVSQ